ncbi:hypothetical protein CK203_017148 [Vitis vinifera]|uniref:Uncharacterized protein n=1 Tax=Vitis vinifera TaxID=29760 RepID=A0A438JZD5_VITVI|nr:hypothetical protein CK203_017148 [Vitis vinifera]
MEQKECQKPLRMELKAMCFYAFLVLFVGVIVGLCLCGFSGALEGEMRDTFIQLHGNMARNIRNGFITFTTKSLHFFISKILQFRFSAPLHSAPCTTSRLLFWVGFTRSIGSMDSPIS